MKKDNMAMILYMYCNVNLRCDGEVVRLRYRPNPEKPELNVWFMDGANTGLQVTALIKMLKEKYNNIAVVWKRQF